MEPVGLSFATRPATPASLLCCRFDDLPAVIGPEQIEMTPAADGSHAVEPQL